MTQESDVRFAPPYELPRWPFVPPPELGRGEATQHDIVIAGGGLAGLTLACDLAARGVRALLIDDDDTVGARGASSRGIVYAQKSLEILRRLGLYERVRDKGVTWSVGRTWSGRSQVYAFNLQSDSRSRQPPFVNLQQFYLEWFLVERILELGHVELRWKNRLAGIELHGDRVSLRVDTPAGEYAMRCRWLIDATGAHSPIREQLGLPIQVSRSADRWCISDVRFTQPVPLERWTWVDAPFNEGRAVWQHLMADGVWRLDYQMASDSDPQAISRPEVVARRLRAQLGAGVDFEFVWIGPYQYRDHLLERFRHGPVFFIGDAAHVVSPFGARGGNTGMQDAANLGWKLALVLQGRAGASLLDSYDAERRPAAAENLQVTSRTARFLAPRSAHERRLRRAVTALARRHAFARALVNTGRMSVANAYPPSAWLPQGGRSVQNVALDDGEGELMDLLADGTAFVAFGFDAEPLVWRAIEALADRLPLRSCRQRAHGVLASHLGAAPGSVALLRPDAYLAGLWPQASVEHVADALARHGVVASGSRA